MRRFLILIPAFFLVLGAPAFSQQSQSGERVYSGQVFNSPMPRVKVVRPAGTPPEDQTTQQDLTIPQDQTAQPDAQTDQATDDDNLPRVVRLGESREDDPPEDTRQDAKPEDGEDRGRFKRAPKREPSFKPDEVVVAVPLSAPRTRLKNGARLRQLDKMTGLIRTYDVAVGETVRVARLRVRLDACRSPGDNDTHGTMAFLKIWDSKYDDPEPDFSGWMFAESPALSALDHPRYDLWVINCTTPLGE